MSTAWKATEPPRAASDRPWLPEVLAWGALLLLVMWGLAPIVYLVIKARSVHASLSGADSLFAADQLQYLGWIRSSGEHLLAANGFALREGGHVFLQPMFALSGLMWRAGMNIGLSYLVWLPAAVGTLYVGFRRFIWSTLSEPMGRAAALILALFFVTPAASLVNWTVGSSGLATISGELSSTELLYGYFPTALAVGLLALFMVGADRVVHAEPGHGRSWQVAATTAAGGLAAWLHPWQGETALVVIAGLLALGRFKRPYLRLLIPGLGTALPLVYYLVLSRIDLAWKVADLGAASGRPNSLLLIPALAPLLLFAVPGLMGTERREPREQILWLWPLAGLLVYFVSPGFATHALEGIALPLVVLAVRGWRRLRLPAWLAGVAIALTSVPGLVFDLKLFHEISVSDPQAMLLHPGERRALAYLARSPTAGGVLPSVRISAAVPAYTGRRTWIGHSSWTPDYAARLAAVTALFDGQLTGAGRLKFLRQLGARYLLVDCEPGFHASGLGPVVVTEHAFGCVHVYELAVPNRAAWL